MPDYGQRVAGAGKKGLGWLGELKRPDGSVSTELSVQFNDVLGGNPIPLLVPALDKTEIEYLLSMKQGGEIPASIRNKAIQHAYSRDKLGLSPFKD